MCAKEYPMSETVKELKALMMNIAYLLIVNVMLAYDFQLQLIQCFYTAKYVLGCNVEKLRSAR